MQCHEKVLVNEEYVNEENYLDIRMLDHLKIFHRFMLEQLSDVLLMQQAIEY